MLFVSLAAKRYTALLFVDSFRIFFLRLDLFSKMWYNRYKKIFLGEKP